MHVVSEFKVSLRSLEQTEKKIIEEKTNVKTIQTGMPISIMVIVAGNGTSSISSGNQNMVFPVIKLNAYFYLLSQRSS